MKKYIPKLLAIFTLILLTSCSSDDGDDGMVPLQDIPAINAALMSGDWVISQYAPRFGSDETLTYSAYTFTFMANGVVNATDGTTALTGAWSVIEATNESGESLNHVEFNVFFNFPEEFVEISDDWDVTAWTTTKIDATAVLKENTKSQTITFTKK